MNILTWFIFIYLFIIGFKQYRYRKKLNKIALSNIDLNELKRYKKFINENEEIVKYRKKLVLWIVVFILISIFIILFTFISEFSLISYLLLLPSLFFILFFLKKYKEYMNKCTDIFIKDVSKIIVSDYDFKYKIDIDSGISEEDFRESCLV